MTTWFIKIDDGDEPTKSEDQISHEAVKEAYIAELRALLIDTQKFIGGACRDGCTHWGCVLRRRIDAALGDK